MPLRQGADSTCSHWHFFFIGTIILAYLPGINQCIPFTELDFIHNFEPVCLIYYLEMDLIFVPVIPLLLLIYA